MYGNTQNMATPKGGLRQMQSFRLPTARRARRTSYGSLCHTEGGQNHKKTVVQIFK